MRKMISCPPTEPLISSIQGQNYWFHGCMAYLMKCVEEEAAYDYWFFSGVTGDSFLQVYSKNPENMVLCYSHIFTADAAKKAFGACGYSYEYLEADVDITRDALDDRVREYLEKDIPVIASLEDDFHTFAILCGYDETGFYFVWGDDTQPRKARYHTVILLGEKTESPKLADTYKKAVMSLLGLLATPETEKYSFGKKAFYDWAGSFEGNLFAKYPLDDKIWYTHGDPTFSSWNMHGTYLCMLGTNICAVQFLQKALELNPEMAFIHQLIPIYQAQNDDGFGKLIGMEGGFSLPPEAIQDSVRMKPVCEEIRKLGDYYDEIFTVFQKEKGIS